MLELLVPMMSGWRPGAVAWGIVALYTLIAVQVTSLLMSRLPRRLWHTVHLSSLGLFVMATVHGVQAGSDLSNTLITWIGATATTLLVFAAVYRVLARSGRRRVPA